MGFRLRLGYDVAPGRRALQTWLLWVSYQHYMDTSSGLAICESQSIVVVASKGGGASYSFGSEGFSINSAYLGLAQ